MEQLKDDSIAGTSDENSKIKEEVRINNEYDFPENISAICKELSVEERTFRVKFGGNGKKYLVSGLLTDSILHALRSSKRVRDWMDSKKTEEFYLIERKESSDVCVNLGMPLKYVSENSLFEMKSYRPNTQGINENTNEGWYRQYDNSEKECIVFYIRGIGSRMENSGALSRRLIKKPRLLNEYCVFCIFAPKEESIKDALCKDGRFLPLLKEEDWALIKDGTLIENKFPVNILSDKVYEIEVESKKGARCSGDQNKKLNDLDLEEQQLSTLENPQPPPDFEEEELSASKKQQPEPDCEQGQLSTSKKQQQQNLEWQILQLYPKLKEAQENIEKFLTRNKKDFEVYKREFCKEINDVLSFKLVKTLAKKGDSVGFIEWKNLNSEGSATCFVLHGRYILTCYHVIKFIVGEGNEAKDWGNIIKQSARVTFSFEEEKPEEKWFSLENWFEIADADLDFAVLKLEENENKSRHPPSGLLQLHFLPDANGPIFIIGHPNGEIKSMDICLVVSRLDRGNEFSNHLNKRKQIECSKDVCGNSPQNKCIHMYNPKDFERERSDLNVVTYNTCFLRGSSGSPVFTKDGHLVALHAAGFAYKMGSKECSIIEYGYLMHEIFSKIQSEFKDWYDTLIAPEAREDSSHGDARMSEAAEEMDCSSYQSTSPKNEIA
ncbi:protein FAM111A [Notechis scutatus]|uniref:Protein FAM111A n=1 Tax=Notechis scutatus TaxID=8663 RepID=A0A6J1V8G7_9SAUR|nr:protein FAM111A [Notechis scutatus]XP_026539572.1 protein FAM111A [Notechis scutatus]